MSDAEDRVGVDFTVDPLSYPGAGLDGSSLLLTTCRHRLGLQPHRRLGQAIVGPCTSGAHQPPAVPHSLDAQLLQENTEGVDRRYPVVAVGSNGSPEVLRGKLLRAGVSPVVPLVVARTVNLGIGHSAHVAGRGYVPAAPLHQPGSQQRVVVSWLTHLQMGAVDRTEPNYWRVLLSSADYPLELEPHGEGLSHYYVYVTGSVIAEAGTALPFCRDQRDVARWLDERGVAPWAGSTPESAAAALGSDDALRPAVHQALLDRDLCRAAGIRVAAPPADHRAGEVGPVREPTYGAVVSSWPGPSRTAGLRCQATPDSLRRDGEQVVLVDPGLGLPGHVVVRAALQPDRPGVVARVVTSETVQEGCAGVDQVIRNALGVELGESVIVSPVRDSPHGPADWLFGRPRYIVCRVQVADLVTIEQDVALVTPLVLDLLGVASGSRVYIEGHAEAGGEPRRLSARAHALPDSLAAARTHISGGGLDARYPSALHALGVHPDLPWVFLDAAMRARAGLGHHHLAVVRIRANPWDQLSNELREMLLLFVLAAVGLVSFLPDARIAGGIVLALLVVGTALTRQRLQRRLNWHSRRPLRWRPRRGPR